MMKAMDIDQTIPIYRSVMWRLCVMFFMMGMGPGMWLPGLTNAILATGWGSQWVGWAFVIMPAASLLSPLFSGALADQKYPAEKIAGWICLVSSGTMLVAFRELHAAGSPWWFVGWFFVTSVIAAPLWNLVITVAMSHLPHPERQFPHVRLCCTVGWILGGWFASLVMRADATAMAGYAGAVCRILLAMLIFWCPSTPPRGIVRSWRSLLGFDAFRLFRDKSVRVLLLSSAFLSMPIASFYMHTPEHLRDLGDVRSTFTMSFGQWSEVAAMAVTGWLMIRYRLKSLLLAGLICCVVRFAVFSFAGLEQQILGLWLGIAIHGVCYTLFFITSQIYLDRRVEPGMRGQMQGLLGLMTNGIGTLFGTILLHGLHSVTVAKSGHWGAYWLVLTLFTVGCLIWFALQFQEKTPSPDEEMGPSSAKSD